MALDGELLVRPRVPFLNRPSPFKRNLNRFRVTPMTVFWTLITFILVIPILLFLSVAFSPRLMSQGQQWFTLASFKPVFSGAYGLALLHSLILGIVAAVGAMVIALSMAWLVLRTNSPARIIWNTTIFALFLAPSYLIALGWQRLFEQHGVLEIMGLSVSPIRNLLYGPVGICLVLMVKGVPFAYLVIANAMRGLGEEFEQAVRVHGGSRFEAFKVMASLLMPSLFSAMAIVFAEAISDFGVASTLSSVGHFSVATYQLYQGINSIPVNFPVSAATSLTLLALVILAILAQNRALRGRSFRTLSGRTRPATITKLSILGKISTSSYIVVLLLIMLGIPVFGAISASMLEGLGSLLSHYSINFSNYSRVLHSRFLRNPLIYSTEMSLIAATLAVSLAAIASKVLTSTRNSRAKRFVDFFLLAAVALPGIVFAIGYIFTYNLRFINDIGLHIYGTSFLLALAYSANALPSTSRSLVGNMGQIQESMMDAARVHGSAAPRAWLDVTMPLIARPLLIAWLLTFSGTLLELPVSELLYPPGSPPVAVGIELSLAGFDYGGGTAIEILSIVWALVVVSIAFFLFNRFAPPGWKRLGNLR
ncbi:MAG: ABC transporter permease subunit [Actinomycetes bacterium]